jgi:hypothetical protein
MRNVIINLAGTPDDGDPDDLIDADEIAKLFTFHWVHGCSMAGQGLLLIGEDSEAL